MKKIPFTIVAITAISLLAPISLQAKLPAKCIDRLISKSEYKLQDILSTTRSGGRVENVYNNLKNSVMDFMEYSNSNWTRECLTAAPENVKKYQSFVQTKVRPVLSVAMNKKNELCSKATEDLINTSMIKIEDKLKTGSAISYIRELENRLNKSKMITNCVPVKDRVYSILHNELPNIKQNMKVGKYLTSLAWESTQVQRIFEQSQKAFQTKILAPLNGAQSNADFKNTLKNCLSDIKELDKYGYKSDAIVSANGKNIITFDNAKQMCNSMESYGVDKLLAEIKTNNENYQKEWKQAWENKYILGSAMKRTYQENHTRIPARTEDLGSQVIWTYQKHVSRAIFSECKTYSFTKDGEKLLGLQVYACE